MPIDLDAIRARYDFDFHRRHVSPREIIETVGQTLLDIDALVQEIDRLQAITATIRRCPNCHAERIGGRDFEEEPDEPAKGLLWSVHGLPEAWRKQGQLDALARLREQQSSDADPPFGLPRPGEEVIWETKKEPDDADEG